MKYIRSNLNIVSTQIKQLDMLLDFAPTYTNKFIQYHASEILMHVDSDFAYLIYPYASSFTAGKLLLIPPPPVQ